MTFLVPSNLLLSFIIMAVSLNGGQCGLNEALSKYLDHDLKVSKTGEAKAEIEKVVKDVMGRIESADRRFKMGLEFRGSIYEKLKIKDADEFDFDLPITKLTIDEAPRSGLTNDIPMEYTTYKLRPALTEEWADLADKDNSLLSAERVVQKFSTLVKQATDDMNAAGDQKYKFQFKTNHPAVTIIFKKDDKVVYNVDLAPVIEVKKWPENLTTGWEKRKKKGWPSEDLVDSIKASSVYLVPKLYKDKSHAKRDFLWRFAFNKAEKKLLLDSEKSTDNSCRRPVVRIIKGFLVDFDWRGLRSYHIKTILLHEFETYGDINKWKREQTGERVLSAVRRLKSCLEARDGPKLKHYFLPAINIMAGVNEQQRIELVAKLRDFLENPEAALSKKPDGAVCAVRKKEKSESTKAYVKLINDFMRDVKKMAQEESNDRILKLCSDYENGRFQQLGIKDSSL